MIRPTQQSHTFAGRAFLAVRKDTAKSRTASGKPAKECACPDPEKKFSKMPPRATEKKNKNNITDRQVWTSNRLTLWTEKQKE